MRHSSCNAQHIKRHQTRRRFYGGRTPGGPIDSVIAPRKTHAVTLGRANVSRPVGASPSNGEAVMTPNRTPGSRAALSTNRFVASSRNGATKAAVTMGEQYRQPAADPRLSVQVGDVCVGAAEASSRLMPTNTSELPDSR